jgi:hypothetical protein
MKAGFGGIFQYGGRSRGPAVLIWRQVSEAVFNKEAIYSSQGRIFFHVKTKPVNLCPRSSTRGCLHKSI